MHMPADYFVGWLFSFLNCYAFAVFANDSAFRWILKPFGASRAVVAPVRNKVMRIDTFIEIASCVPNSMDQLALL